MSRENESWWARLAAAGRRLFRRNTHDAHTHACGALASLIVSAPGGNQRQQLEALLGMTEAELEREVRLVLAELQAEQIWAEVEQRIYGFPYNRLTGTGPDRRNPSPKER